jgi:DNA-binding transcriptional LysR family regulator
MELRHLRYFAAVGRSLNFTRAAEILHVSQPPLSRQIQEFEEEVGAALLDRTGNKTKLTEAGEYLLVESERLLEAVDVACRTAKAIAMKTRALRVGCVSSFFNTRMPPFFGELGRLKPDLRLDMLVMPTEAQVHALMSGALEVGFVRSWASEETLAFEPIAEELFALVFPATLQLRGGVAERIAALESYPYIGVARSAAEGLAETIAKVCADYGLKPNPAYECNDSLSIMGLVASGLGWSILPDFDFQSAMTEKVSAVKLEHSLVLGLCYRKTGLTDQAKEFMAEVKDYFLGKNRESMASPDR